MLADLVLVMHAAFVLFVVGGLPAIWIGFVSGCRWCVNPWFRGLHLAAIGFVVVESLLGYACPLTVWEDALRGRESGDRVHPALGVHGAVRGVRGLGRVGLDPRAAPAMIKAAGARRYGALILL